jgi:hypothetical protein
MKKVILSLSGILITAFVIIMVANAEISTQDGKKAATPAEKSMTCSKCPAGSASACPKMSGAKASDGKACDPAKCKEAGCDPAKCKEGKGDPSTAKACCPMADTKKCDPATCKGSPKK